MSDYVYPFDPSEYKAGDEFRGLTKRELFAAMMAQAMLPKVRDARDVNNLMPTAILAADRLIAELTKEKTP